MVGDAAENIGQPCLRINAIQLCGFDYAASTESLPFVADDILVHFDDERSAATLDLLARFAETRALSIYSGSYPAAVK